VRKQTHWHEQLDRRAIGASVFCCSVPKIVLLLVGCVIASPFPAGWKWVGSSSTMRSAPVVRRLQTGMVQAMRHGTAWRVAEISATSASAAARSACCHDVQDLVGYGQNFAAALARTSRPFLHSVTCQVPSFLSSPCLRERVGTCMALRGGRNQGLDEILLARCLQLSWKDGC
jgi:hypothetical protein